MARPEEIKAIVREINPSAIFVKGFEDALYGTGKSVGGKTVAVYDADECLKILINKHEMDEIEAWDHFNATVTNGIPAEDKPIFISDWRAAVNTDDILRDIKMEKQQTINDILDELQKRKEEEGEQD